MVLLKAFLVFRAQTHDLGHVALVEGGEHRSGVLCLDKAFRDSLPDLWHLLASNAACAGNGHRHGNRWHGLHGIGNRRHGRRGALNIRHHDSSGRATTSDFRKVDALISSHLLGERGGLLAIHRLCDDCGTHWCRRCWRLACGARRTGSACCIDRASLGTRWLCSRSVDRPNWRSHLLLGAGLHLDAQHTRRGRAHFQGCLVAFNVDQDLIGLHPVAVMLMPLTERDFSDRFARARNHDVQHVILHARCARCHSSETN